MIDVCSGKPVDGDMKVVRLSSIRKNVALASSSVLNFARNSIASLSAKRPRDTAYSSA